MKEGGRKRRTEGGRAREKGGVREGGREERTE